MAFLPRRRTWDGPFGGDWSGALKGMAGGLLAAGIAAGFAMLLEAMYHAGPHAWQRPGPGDMISILVMIPFGIAAYGTVVAIVPMTVVMGAERLLRIDLGVVCWTALGLVPSTVVGLVLPGTVFGGLAMASGGIGGMTAYAMRHAARPGTVSRWGEILIAGLAIAALMVAFCLGLPPLADSD
jgi:hypothetical protein